jgi:hypothetical protein
VSGEALAVIVLAFRACTEALCCWQVRLDDGTSYQEERGAEATFAIPRQGLYFEARAARGICSDPGVWSDWSRFDWLHTTDFDADGEVGLADLGAIGSAFRSDFRRFPDATEYFYCLRPGEGAADDLVPPPHPSPPALEEIASGGSSAASVVATATALRAEVGARYVSAIATKPHTEVTGVSGLGLVWTPVRSQCSGRRQTGVSVWQARGEPIADGIITATLSSAPIEAVIAASRYSGNAVVGTVVSGNTLGASGACSGGSDADAYAVDLDTTGTDSLVHVWVAMRLREHFSGTGFAERLEIHQGSRAGDRAGLVLAEGGVGSPMRVGVTGSFDSTVDWAVVAMEIRQPMASE